MSALQQLLGRRGLRSAQFVGLVGAYIAVLIVSIVAATSLLNVGLSVRRLAWTGTVTATDIGHVFIISTIIATVLSMTLGYSFYRRGT